MSALCAKPTVAARRSRQATVTRAAVYNGAYAEELIATAVSLASSHHSLQFCASTPSLHQPAAPHDVAAEQDRQPRQGHPW